MFSGFYLILLKNISANKNIRLNKNLAYMDFTRIKSCIFNYHFFIKKSFDFDKYRTTFALSKK